MAKWYKRWVELKLARYLLDTNSIITALKIGFVFPKHDYIFSIITEIELLSYHKLLDKDSEILQKALSNFTCIGLSDEIKNETINIRKKTNMKLPDSLIVASSIVEKAVLVTSDKQLLNSNLLHVVELKDLVC